MVCRLSFEFSQCIFFTIHCKKGYMYAKITHRATNCSFFFMKKVSQAHKYEPNELYFSSIFTKDGTFSWNFKEKNILQLPTVFHYTDRNN